MNKFSIWVVAFSVTSTATVSLANTPDLATEGKKFQISGAPVTGANTQIASDKGLHDLFSDVYSEHSALAKASTLATFTQLRAGTHLDSNFELYATARVGADSRTLFEQGPSVYNDNYLFLGTGLDYLGMLRGVRFTFQLGASQDLTNKIHTGGLDGRLGVITFFDLRLGSIKDFYSEIYTETLYIQRYRNLMSNSQLRFFYSGIHLGSTVRLEPMLNFAGAMDTSGLDYNRYFEARLGFRFSYHAPIDISFIPFYSVGRFLYGPGYNDVRAVLALSKSF